MAETKEPTLTIEDKEYKIADLPEDAKKQLASFNYAEAEIRRLQAQLALVTTARNAYRKAIVDLVQEKK